MYSTIFAVVFTAILGLSCALPPFEIRSSGAKSEGATQWMHHLQRQKQCSDVASSLRLVCPSTLLVEPQCLSWEQLCDGQADCPEREDEIPAMCVFLKMRAHAEQERYGRY